MNNHYEKEERLKVVYVEPDKPAKIIEVDNTLEELQRLVGGGLIQPCYYFDEPVTLVCNDEGWLLGMPPNRAVFNEKTGEILTIISGSFFLCYAPPYSEHFHSLSEKQLRKYKEKFRYPELFVKTDLGIAVVSAQKKKRSRDRRDEGR